MPKKKKKPEEYDPNEEYEYYSVVDWLRTGVRRATVVTAAQLAELSKDEATRAFNELMAHDDIFHRERGRMITGAHKREKL